MTIATADGGRLGFVRGLVGVVVVLAACGGSQPRTTVTNTAADPKDPWAPVVALDRPVAAQRPEISVEQLVPDFHEELRWPLSAMAHPELEPQFEIASVFAMPGIGWIELCERGVQNRVQSGRNRDELEYLRGWCSAIKGDADTACGKLKPLMTTTVLGMAKVVRHDIANIIASAGDIDAADKLMNKHRFDDVELLDILAATFIELGRESDAREMNRRAMDSVGHTTNAEHCRRLTKSIALGGDTPSMTKLEDLATKSKTPDPVCVELFHEVQCVLGPAQNCHAYFDAHGIDTRNTFLLHAFRSWPTGPVNYVQWTSLVYAASNAGGIEGAKELATVALDAAMISATEKCEPRTMAAIGAYVRNWPTPPLEELMTDCRWTPPAKP